LISAKLENLIAIVFEIPQEVIEFGLKIVIRKIEDCDWKLKGKIQGNVNGTRIANNNQFNIESL
jgi:ribose 5-phosphate isomerase